MTIEGKDVGELLPAHDLEAHGDDEGEALVRESHQPSGGRLAQQLRRDVDPFVHRIIEQMDQGGPRGRRSAQVEQMRIELTENEGRSEIATTGGQMALGDGDRAGMMLILFSTEREKRARVS